MQHITQKNNCSISEFAIGSFCLPFVIDHFQSIWQCVYFGEIREDYVKPFFNRILICINIFVALDKNISPHNSSICTKNRWPSQGEEKNKRDKERKGQIQSRFYSPFSVMTPLEPYLYWLSTFNCYFNAGERTETWGNQEIEKPQKKRDYGEAWEIKRSVDAQ